MGKLEGKVALVIGGTASDGYSSIGAAMAHFLAEEGVAGRECKKASCR